MGEDPVADPYRSCERHCTHDLGVGVLLSELLGSDGPHPPGFMLVTLTPRSEPALFDDELTPVSAHAAR